MQITDRINAIEERAQAINLSLAGLCKLAGVHLSTLERWQSGACDPKMGNANRILGKLESKLDDREEAILIELQKRHPEARSAA